MDKVENFFFLSVKVLGEDESSVDIYLLNGEITSDWSWRRIPIMSHLSTISGLILRTIFLLINISESLPTVA